MSTSRGQHHGTSVGVKDGFPCLPAAPHHLAQVGLVKKWALHGGIMLERSCIMILWNLTLFVLVWPSYCLWVASVPLARWQLSYLDRGKLYILGSGGWMCTSASLEHGQQASLLVTWAEVALLWGALVPVLLPAVLLATGTNMLMCKVGHGHFGVDRLDTAATGMSRRYLHGSLCVLVCFQNWFAWSSGMHGRWLLLLTALIYALELGGFLSFGYVQTRNMVAIVNDRCPPSNGDNDVEMIRGKANRAGCGSMQNGRNFYLLPHI